LKELSEDSFKLGRHTLKSRVKHALDFTDHEIDPVVKELRKK